jgi:hypothetical protein
MEILLHHAYINIFCKYGGGAGIFLTIFLLLVELVQSSKLHFFEFASVIGLLLYSIWSRLWLSLKALVV